MPVYHILEMKKKQTKLNPAITVQSVKGELMKVGISTKPEGEAPPLHMHPNEEQFTLILKGKVHVILEMRILSLSRATLFIFPALPHIALAR
jgi:hypothetical protein